MKLLYTFILLLCSSLCAAEVYILSDSDVKNYIKATPALQAWADKHDETDFSGLAESDGSDLTERMVAHYQNHPRYQELERLVKQQGFKNGEHFFNVAGSVAEAYMGVVIGDQEEQFAQARAEFEASMKEAEAYMSAGQIEVLKSQMQLQFAQLDQLGEGIPERNKQLIRNNQAALDRLMCEEGDC